MLVSFFNLIDCTLSAKLVNQGAVNREVTGVTKKYKGVGARMAVLRTEMKTLRADCNRRARAKAAAAN
jgi:uncharacterized small protein (DUF1192 family)